MKRIQSLGVFWFLLVLAPLPRACAGDPTPKVVATWPAGPFEVRVALDRPADPSLPAKLVGKRIGFGDTIKPGEVPSTTALSDPTDPTKGSIGIADARLTEEGRTLILATDPHPRDTTYTFRIPFDMKPATVIYTLRGVEASWEDGTPGSDPVWSGWWPTLDPKASLEALAGSEEEVTLATLLSRSGRLTLRTLAVLPKGKPTLLIKASVPFEATLFGTSAVSKKTDERTQSASLSIESTGDLMDLSLSLATKAHPIKVSVEMKPGEKAASTPLGGADYRVTWVPTLPPSFPSINPDPILYAGGDAKKGEQVFASENAKCVVCHKFRGKGGIVGPALDELSTRHPSWVYRQIAEPSGTIHPEYIPYTVVTKDGQIVIGIVRASGPDKIVVTDTEAKSLTVLKKNIEDLRPSTTSIMPVGLTGVIGEQGMKDLIAYLTSKTK